MGSPSAEKLSENAVLGNHTDTPDAEKNTPQENGPQVYQGRALLSLLALLMTGQFLMGLDATIITTALPRITSDFHSLDDVGWYGLIYVFTTTATLPIWNKIFMYFNVKYSFMVAIFLFELGSVICAVAPSSAILILGRAVSGVGQAAMLAGGTIMITYQFPVHQRAMYFSVLQSTGLIAQLVGPLLGGVFTDTPKLTWRFCFWFNLPFALVLVIGVLMFFKNPHRPDTGLPLKQKIMNLDFPGAVLFTASWFCLFMGLERAGYGYQWYDSRLWGWFVGFVLGIIVFLIFQWHQGDKATIPLRVLRNRTVASSCLYTCFISIGIGTFSYFLPFYFQTAKGVSAKQSGIYLIPFLASLMISCLSSGALLSVYGRLTPFLLFGSATFTLGAGLLTMLEVGSSPGIWIGFQILLGLGMGSTTQFSIVAIQAVLGVELAAIGNGLFFVSNFGGISIGVGLAETLFLSVLKKSLEQTFPPETVRAIINAGATAISTAVPLESVSIVQNAYCYAITRMFFLGVGVGSAAFLAVLRIKWINLRKTLE